MNDELKIKLLEALEYALRDTNAIAAYVFNEIEPIFDEACGLTPAQPDPKSGRVSSGS